MSMSSPVTGLFEIGKRFTVFILIADVVDTMIVLAAASSGVRLPSYAAFAPPQLINYLYSFDQQLHNMSFTNLYAFFVFIIAINAIVALVNFIIGIIAGGPLLAAAVANALGALPGMIGLAAAFIAFMTFMQALSLIYVLYVFLGITLP